MKLDLKIFGPITGLILLLLSGCTSPSSTINDKETDTSKSQQAESEGTAAVANGETKEQVNAANIITRKSKVPNRGAYIKILVNRNPITNLDIQQRSNFLKLRRVQGNRSQLAEKELIEQILKLQEATRTRTLADDKTVDDAFANFAKQNRTTPANLTRELNKMGVSAKHFKNFIRTQISWQRTIGSRFQAETRQMSEREAINQLKESGGAKPKVKEYSFKQIVFVVPKSQRSKTKLNSRRSEANKYRQQFASCNEAINLAKQYRDVSVLDRKRVMEPELPVRWKDKVEKVNSNGITGPVETEKGIELMAICKTQVVDDDRAAQISSQSAEFESFNEKGSEFNKKYIEELKSNATIIYQ